MTMTVHIDSEKCCGYGICAEICSVFKLDDLGFVRVDDETVSEEDAAAAIEAADACPEAVITFTSV
jgi:ferredoxin